MNDIYDNNYQLEYRFYNLKRVLKKVNINIYDENEKTKSFENILIELSEIWDKIDEKKGSDT